MLIKLVTACAAPTETKAIEMPVMQVTDYDVSQMVHTQAAIWVPIALFFITLISTCFVMGANDDKSQDSLLYAKFITNFKER